MSGKNNLIDRLKTHRTSMPFGVTVVCVLKVKDYRYSEQIAFKKFARYALINTPFIKPQHNCEWYWQSPGMWLWMNTINNEFLRYRIQQAMHTLE